MWEQTPALLLTLAVEVPLAGILANAFGAAPRRTLFAALLASFVTHPVAWQLAINLGPDDYWVGVALIESVVIVIEAGTYRLLCCNLRQAVYISFACNATSWMAGMLLFKN